jgi:peptide chain release factor 1
VLRVTGKHAVETFQHEPGGHRWQRIPPTEKRGRVQTSTITVAVLPEPTEAQIVLRDGDLDYKFCRGSGAGGQHRNVTDSAVVLTHKPTGVVVRCESERSQNANKETALAVLRARIWEVTQLALDGKRAHQRRQQVGSGMRGDKIRTIRVRDDVVNDHVTGRQWKFRDYERGNW